VWLRTRKGKERSRPFSELRRLWQALQMSPAIHVDSVLGGSGSSRNQPETILANLPYVEWFQYDGKKHLTLVGSPTHPNGTLKQLDPLRAQEIRSKMKKELDSQPTTSAILIVD